MTKEANALERKLKNKFRLAERGKAALGDKSKDVKFNSSFKLDSPADPWRMKMVNDNAKMIKVMQSAVNQFPEAQVIIFET